MDILYSDTAETPVIRQGDFEINEITEFQHVRHILIGEKGEYRNAPLVGVGLRRQIGRSGSFEELTRKAKLQLEIDGYQVNKIEFNEQQTIVEVVRL